MSVEMTLDVASKCHHAVSENDSRAARLRHIQVKRLSFHRTPGCRIAILAHTGSATVSPGERVRAMPIRALLS
jgi:hypothetical protein